MSHIILRLPAVKTRTGLSRSTIYLRVAEVNSQSPYPWALAQSAGSTTKSTHG